MDNRFIPIGRDESGITGKGYGRLIEYAKYRAAMCEPSRAVRRQMAKLAKKQKKQKGF